LKLLDAGITPRGKKRFITATKEIVERDEENDISLLGVRTIEGFGVMVDNNCGSWLLVCGMIICLGYCVHIRLNPGGLIQPDYFLFYF
jgi:hypothetical protein